MRMHYMFAMIMRIRAACSYCDNTLYSYVNSNACLRNTQGKHACWPQLANAFCIATCKIIRMHYICYICENAIYMMQQRMYLERVICNAKTLPAFCA